MVQKVRIPPDGGFGWMVVFSHALHHLVAIPVMQTFGLLFKDTFTDLGFTATDTSLIMNTNAAFAMFMGMINGPLLKHFGYRKVSICGAALLTSGVVLTAYAYTFAHYMIAYGLITSMGIGMGLSSYPLALNSYFIKNRSKAAGYTMTISGLGPVVMPQVISLLLFAYGIKGATIIMGGIAGHTFVSAVLLQPVEWHMKEEIVPDDKEDEERDKLLSIDEREEDEEDDADNLFNKRMAASQLSLQEELEIESKYGIDSPLAGSVLSLYQVKQRSRKNTLTNSKFPEESSITSDVENHIVNHDEKDAKMKDDGKLKNSNVIKVYDTELSKEKKKKRKTGILNRIGKNIVKTFDLTLLNDPIYVNIMIGMSLAVFAELNFSILTPFIMRDFDMSTQEIATFMSVLSIADICFRFIAPYVSDFFKQSARIMYMWALVLLMLSRFSLLISNNFYYMLGCAIFLGIAKGFRTVYWSLVIPNYVPIERLASALGLQSTLNGLFIWVGGPFLGFVRDITDSYTKCIYVINSMTALTLIMWTTELVYQKCKSPKKGHEIEAIK